MVGALVIDAGIGASDAVNMPASLAMLIFRQILTRQGVEFQDMETRNLIKKSGADLDKLATAIKEA